MAGGRHMSVTSHEWTKKILNYDLLCAVLNFPYFSKQNLYNGYNGDEWQADSVSVGCGFFIAKLPHLSYTYNITNIYRFQENYRSPQVQGNWIFKQITASQRNLNNFEQFYEKNGEKYTIAN
jgi:hypothetical protein